MARLVCYFTTINVKIRQKEIKKIISFKFIIINVNKILSKYKKEIILLYTYFTTYRIFQLFNESNGT